MDFVLIVGLWILLVVAIIAVREVVLGHRYACFVIEVYNSILSFEWKTREEIGKRIHASQHEFIAPVIDKYYKKEAAHFKSREKFCKALARQILGIFEEVGWADLRREKVTEEWLVENAFLLRELSEEERKKYLDHETNRARLIKEVNELGGDELREAKQYAVGAIASIEETGIFDLILARKKPGGKRPPKLSGRKARKTLSGLSGAHA